MENLNKPDQSRRSFLAGAAGAGALAALGETATLRDALAQAAPATGAPAAPPGIVTNEAIKAGKVPAMQYHSERPLTGSVPAYEQNFEFTPTDRVFVRNNLLTPDLDIATHRLTVKGLVDKEVSFTVAELQKAFPAVTMAGMLECAGAGRSNYLPTASGTPWGPTGGMSCPVWTGVRLKDVLAAAGLKAQRRARRRPGRRSRRGGDRGAGDPLHSDVQGDGREHPHRLGDERRPAAEDSRFSAAPGRAGLGRLGLDQMAAHPHGARCALQGHLHDEQLCDAQVAGETRRENAARHRFGAGVAGQVDDHFPGARPGGERQRAHRRARQGLGRRRLGGPRRRLVRRRRHLASRGPRARARQVRLAHVHLRPRAAALRLPDRSSRARPTTAATCSRSRRTGTRSGISGTASTGWGSWLSRPDAIRAAALAAALCCAGAFAQDDRLISGPGSTLTENKCKICHELQHIRRARLSPGEWADNLRNMKERGTPMTDEEMRAILEYLAVYYNRDQPPPAPSPDTLAAGGDDPVQKLLNANACNGCHAVDKRIVGPSFREVAAKYGGRPRCAGAPCDENPQRRSGRLGRGADAAESADPGRRPAPHRGLGTGTEVGRKNRPSLSRPSRPSNNTGAGFRALRAG